MYADPALIRKNVVKLTLNDVEWALIRAQANYDGGQVAVMCRELLMEKARAVFHAANFGGNSGIERRAK